MQFELSSLVALVASALWTLARISGVLLTAPPFNSTALPSMVRAGLALLLTILLAPLVPAPAGLHALSWVGLAVLAQQLLIGAALGFVLRLVIEACVYAGQLSGFSMGLSYGEVVDPNTGASTPVLGQFYILLATLLLLASNAHLRLLAALADSFRMLPVGAGVFTPSSAWMLLQWAGILFSGAVQVALPVLAAMLVVNVGMAITSRAAPALNLFAVGFPATLLIGIVALWFSLAGFSGVFSHLLDSAFDAMARALAAHAPAASGAAP